MAKLIRVELLGEEARCTFTCRRCKREVAVEVPQSGYAQWLCGAFAQRAFPNLPPAQRELFISGMCSECFNKLFKEWQSERRNVKGEAR